MGRARVWAVRYDSDGNVWATAERYLTVVGAAAAAANKPGRKPGRKPAKRPRSEDAPAPPSKKPAAAAAFREGDRVVVVANGAAGTVVSASSNNWIKVRLDDDAAPGAEPASFRGPALRRAGGDASDDDDDEALDDDGSDALYDADGACVDDDLAAVLDDEAYAFAAAREPAAPAPMPAPNVSGAPAGVYAVGDRVEVLHFKGRPAGVVVAPNPPGYDVRLETTGLVWPLDPRNDRAASTSFSSGLPARPSKGRPTLRKSSKRGERRLHGIIHVAAAASPRFIKGTSASRPRLRLFESSVAPAGASSAARRRPTSRTSRPRSRWKPPPRR